MSDKCCGVERVLSAFRWFFLSFFSLMPVLILFYFFLQSCSWGFSRGEPGNSWWTRASCHVSFASCPSITQKKKKLIGWSQYFFVYKLAWKNYCSVAALKSPAAFHEQIRSLERARVRHPRLKSKAPNVDLRTEEAPPCHSKLERGWEGGRSWKKKA